MSGGRLAIVGGGVSGLAAAWRATQAGREVVVFEAGSRVGGAVRSERLGPWLIERGPHTLQATEPVLEMVRSLGLAPVTAAAGAKLKRYVARGGRLQALPSSPQALLTGSFFSWGTKMRIAREAAAPLPPPKDDVSFAALIRSRFGEEALTWAAQPFVSGIYAGDPARLSTRHAFPRLWAKLQRTGSLLRGGAGPAGGASPAPLASFPGGLGDLIGALGARLRSGTIRTDAPIATLGRRPGGGWTLAGEPFEEVLLTVPAHAAAQIKIDGAQHAAAEALRSIPHPPVTVLNLGYPREAVPHPLDGFGCLFPSAERRSILGVIFVSTLFPDRAPTGHVALTVMLGGSLQPAMAVNDPDRACRLAEPDLRAYLGVAAPPAFCVSSHYPAAIPQPGPDHGAVLDALASIESAHPGLRFEGAYRHGISLPDCLAPLSTLPRPS